MVLRQRWFVVPAALAALLLLLLVLVQLGPVRARVLAGVVGRLRTDFGIDLTAARLDYSPFTLSVRLEQARLAAVDEGVSRPAPTPFLEADEIRVDLPWSVAVGRFAIDRIVLSRPRLTIVRDEHGALNLPRARGNGAGLARLPIGVIGVDGGEVQYVDRQHGFSIEARGLSLALQPVAAGVSAGPVSIASLRLRAGGRETATTRLEGGVRYDGANVSFERLQGAAPEGNVRIDGRLASVYASPQVDLTYQASLDLARLAPWLSLARAPTGTVAASGHITGALSNPQATAAFSGDGLSWAAWRSVSLQGAALVSMDGATVRSLELSSPDGRATATAAFDFAGSGGSRAHAEWHDVALATVLDSLEVDAPVRLAARLDGHADASWRAARLDGLELRAENTARPPVTPARGAIALEGSTRLFLGGGAYRLDQEHRLGGALQAAGLAEGSVSAGAIGDSGLRGTARVTSSDLAAAIRQLGAAGLDLSALERLGLNGRAQAELVLSGTLGAPRAEGPVSATGVRIAGAPPAALSASLTMTPREVRAETIDLRAGANRVRGRVVASLDRRTLDGELSGDFAALGDALAAVPARWRPRGAATASATLGGTFAVPRVDATLAATDLDAAGQHVGSARAAVRLDGATLTVESLELTQPGGGRLTASATYGLDDDRYAVKVEGTSLAVRPIPGDEAGAGALPLDAVADLRFEGAGELTLPSGKGAVEVHRLAWNGVEAGPGRVDVSLDRGTATIDASATDLRAAGHGTVSIPAPHRFTARGEVADLDLARLYRAFGSGEAHVTGVLALSGTASGDLERLEAATAEIEVRRFEATHEAGTIALLEPTTIAYRDGALTAGRIALRAGGTSIVASGRLARGTAGGRLDLALDGDLKDLLPFVPGAADRQGLEASGALTLNVTATGSLDRPDVTGDLRLEDGRVAAAGLPAASALGLTAVYRAGVVELTGLRGVWQGAVLVGSGRLPARLLERWLPAGYLASLLEGDRTARLSARVEPITRAALEPWVSADTLAQLDVSAAASLTLEADRPSFDALNGELVLDRLSLSAARVPIKEERPTRLVIAGGRLTVADWTWTGGGTRLTVSGGAGLADRQLDLAVKGTSDLRVLSAFLPGAATAGTADVDVRVRGRADDAELDGQIALAGGELSLRSPRVSVTDLTGTIALARNRIVVRGIGGNANGGLIQIEGELEHDAFTLTGGALSLVGRRIALDAPEGLRTEVDADLTLDVAADATMTLGGNVMIQRGAYRNPIVLTSRVLDLLRSGSYVAATAGEPSWLDRVRLDVAVVTASDVVVNDNYGQVSVGADLRVGGTIGRPALAGRATLREGGQIFLGGNTYRVQRGTVDFVDPSGIEPDLNFTAGTRVASYDITLDVTGTPGTIKANLSSADPTLSQGDLVSLLVTGRTLADAGAEQTAAARDQALSLLSGDILGFAGRAVGVDTLRLTKGEPTDEFTTDPSLVATETDPATRVTITKRLSRQVEIVLSQSLRQSGGLTWIAIYRPVPSLELRGVSLDDGSRTYEAFHQLTFGGGATDARPAPRARASRVADVRITGTPGVDERELRSKLAVDAGDRFDFFTWQEDRDRLQRFYYDRGYLEAKVAASRGEAGDGRVTLTYDVARGPKTVLEVQGYALPAEVRDQLRAWWAGAVFDGFLVEDLQAQVKTALARDGYLRAAVSASVRRSGAGADVQKTIVLRVDPGPWSATRRIAFRGNARMAAERLQAVLAAQDLELAAWLEPSTVQAALVGFYRSEGLLDATVRIGAPEFDTGTATLPVVIDEGPLFHVAAVRVEGVHGLADVAVRQAFGVAEGAPYVPVRVDEGRQRVEQAYRRDGFAAARVTVTPDVSRERAEVALALDVQEGPQRVLAGVDVEGAPGTSRGVVDRALQAKPGEPVDPESWYQARRRLYDTGVFRSADIEFTPAGAATSTGGVTHQPVRAEVALQEWPPWRLRYGFRLDDQVAPSGIGRDLSPGVLVDLQQRNLFGRAIGAGVTGSYQKTVKLARAFLTMPRFVGLPVKTNIFLTRSRQTLNSEGALPFLVDESILSAEQQLQPLRDLKVTYGYRFERDHTFDPKADPTDPLALNFTVNIARLNAAAVIDTRTDPFNPTGGWFHASNLEYAASILGSDLRFVKYLAQQYYFHEVGPVTLASAVRFGAGHGLGQDLIPSERFYAGGGTTVRGCAQDGLGPEDYFGDPMGGDAMLVVNQEARFPVYRWVRAVGFVDAGNVFPGLGDLSIGALKVGIGVGLRLDTPFALLRVDFGVPLSRQPGEPRGRWYVSFGQIF